MIISRAAMIAGTPSRTVLENVSTVSFSRTLLANAFDGSEEDMSSTALSRGRRQWVKLQCVENGETHW